MKSKKFIGKILLGIGLMLPAVGIFYAEYISGETLVDDAVEIVVFKENVSALSGAVSEDMLTTSIRSAKDLEGIPNYVTSVNDVVGLEATNFIPRNTLIVKEYFGEVGSALREDEVVFSIPNDWIYSMPQTIRRGDSILFYPMKPVTNNVDAFATGDFKSESNYVTESIVMYAKDSANREVQTIGSGERFDGSSNVTNIEIRATKDMIDKLKSYIMSGYKFIITYN